MTEQSLDCAVDALRRGVSLWFELRPPHGLADRPVTIGHIRSFIRAIRVLQETAARERDAAVDNAYPRSGGEA